VLDTPQTKATATSVAALKATALGSFPAYVDSSMLTAWRSCKRKHFWSTIHALYPTGKSVHLIAGGAFAAGLEAARKRLFTDPNPATVTHEELLFAAYPAFLLEWGDYNPPENHAKSFVNTFCALDHYLLEYPPYTDKLQPYIRPDGTPAVEYRFAVPLEDILHPTTGEPILFVGRFDQIAMYIAGDVSIPCIQDEKTTYAFALSWADQWDMRGQFIGYIWALRQQGFNVSHAAIRGIAIQKTQFQTRTALTEYPNHLISRWERQMKRDISDMIHSYTVWTENEQLDDEHHYPFNFGDSCESYGGCAFKMLCLARDPEPFMSNFIRHRWNPLEKQPVEELPK